MLVPFFKQDLINRAYAAGLHDAVNQLVYAESPLVSGHYTIEFEKQFAQFVGSSHCAFVSNGLDALILALRAVGIKNGDTIIVPCHTYVATWLAPLSLGCRIIAVPVRQDNFLLDAERLVDYLTPEVKCIMPVHLYGNTCDMNAIIQLAKSNNILIVEDAAQAHGSIYESKMIGSWGDATCFSFYPTKNLGALGEAGAVCSASIKVNQVIRSLRNYGRDISDGSCNLLLGGNFRGDELQAAFLSEKLKLMHQIVERRRAIISLYKSQIKPNEFIHGLIEYQDLSAPHLAVLKTSSKTVRDNLLTYLGENGIQSAVHYSKPCHAQPCLEGQHLKIDEKTKHQASTIADTIISIPMSEVHSDEEISIVSNTINEFALAIS